MKILVIRFSSIGDIVLTTPVVRCLKKQVPDAEIHYLTKKDFHPVIAENPYIKKVWQFENSFSELIPKLKAENFNFIIDLHKNFRSRYVILKLGRPSGTFPKLNIRKWILVNLKINILPDIHIVDRYFNAVRHFNLINDGEGLDYFIPNGEEVDLSGLLPSAEKNFIAFSIGGKHFTKILPEEKVVEICNKIDKIVILLGGSEDIERADRIAGRSNSRVINGCGRYSISQSASIIRQSSKIITNDTGLMHIAAAFRKPVISVWGNTVPAFGMYPYLPEGEKEKSKIVEVTGLPCRPCSKIGFDKCPKRHFRCMNDQNTDQIIRILQE
jgi:ADP-heptose:LPS heptosyltransferase